jgi:spore germination protein GerM
MKRKSKKKKRTGRTLFVLILIGFGLFALIHFRQEILEALRPRVEKRVPPKEMREITLYFSDEGGQYLIGEKRKILKKNRVGEEAKETIIELIHGPKGRLIPTLPSRTKLLTLQIDDTGVAKVNFSPALSKDHPGGSSAEMMTAYSIVNSLTVNFSQIKRVQILIDGKPIETLTGHLSLRGPVPPKLDLIQRQ